jgi:putative transcriptional regulator
MRTLVRERRTEASLSQGALASAVGVSRQTINAIETGRYQPSLRLAFGLARYFGVAIEDLFHPEPGDLAT